MRWFRAPAKINLSLSVLARRPDGLHEIESLVAFAEIGDWLGYQPGRRLELDVEGPAAPEVGPPETNLVLRAARALAARIPDPTLGRFRLVKRLPSAAGMGGGSSDAAAALAALAEANGLPEDDERLLAAASETGADVPVCLFPKARMMSGTGERLGAPVALPDLFAVLANPRVPAPTREVFEALGLAPGRGASLREGGCASLRTLARRDAARSEGARPRAPGRRGRRPSGFRPRLEGDGHPRHAGRGPQRSSAGGNSRRSRHRNGARDAGAPSRSACRADVGFGGDLLCFVRQPARRRVGAKAGRRRAAALVGQGDPVAVGAQDPTLGARVRNTVTLVSIYNRFGLYCPPKVRHIRIE